MKKCIFFFATVILTASFVFAQNEENQRQLQKFRKDHSGKISVEWHEHSGGPKRIIGDNIYLKSRSINKTNVQAATEKFIYEYQDLLNTRGIVMKLDRITELGNRYIVAYQQYYENLPLWNVKLKLKVTVNGQVLTIKSPCYSNLNISTEPKISINEAKQIALTCLNADDDSILGKNRVVEKNTCFPYEYLHVTSIRQHLELKRR